MSNVVDSRERAQHETHLPTPLTTAEIPAATGEYQVHLVEDAKKLTVSLKVQFTPTGGSSASKTVKVTFKR